MNIYIDIFGCTANQSDASIARQLLERDSTYTLIQTSSQADIIVLFTCTVISSTEQRMLSKIKTYRQQGKTVVVTGCMAQIQKELIRQIDETIICIPPTHIHQLLSYLKTMKYQSDPVEKYQHKKQFNTLQAPIAISEGCDFSCSYCITTLARGKLQSVPPSLIKRDVIEAIRQGCKEIQLTAQDTASYGRDKKITLAALLTTIQSIPGWYRIRLGMMNPATLLPQVHDIIKCYYNKHLFTFLHIPIQTGNDDLLTKMNRMYSVKDIFQIINLFRSHHPNITIATDIIVGFPGETNAHHQNTKKILKQIQPDITNITKFSARPHTKAKIMTDRVPTDIVKNRSKELTALVSKLSFEKNKNHVGNTYTVLITEQGKHQTMMGRTNQYKPVVIDESVHIGDIVDVKIIDAHPTYLFGILK